MADEDRVLVLYILGRFQFHHTVLGRTHDQSYTAVVEEDPQLLQPIIARATTIGQVPGIHVGDEFVYRAEMRLVGLHNQPVRGICIGPTPADAIVATCLVAKFALHNRFDHLNPGDFIYGGETGRLRDAAELGVRVLEDQRFTERNNALRNSIEVGTPVRLVVRDEGEGAYVYHGLYLVLEYWQEFSNEGLRVWAFRLRREIEQ